MQLNLEIRCHLRFHFVDASFEWSTGVCAPQLRMSLRNILIRASIKCYVEGYQHKNEVDHLTSICSQFINGKSNWIYIHVLKSRTSCLLSPIKKKNFSIASFTQEVKTWHGIGDVRFDEIPSLNLSFCTYFPFLRPGLNPSRAIYVCAVIYQISKYIMQSITNGSSAHPKYV